MAGTKTRPTAEVVRLPGDGRRVDTGVKNPGYGETNRLAPYHPVRETPGVSV